MEADLAEGGEVWFGPCTRSRDCLCRFRAAIPVVCQVISVPVDMSSMIFMQLLVSKSYLIVLNQHPRTFSF